MFVVPFVNTYVNIVTQYAYIYLYIYIYICACVCTRVCTHIMYVHCVYVRITKYIASFIYTRTNINDKRICIRVSDLFILFSRRTRVRALRHTGDASVAGIPLPGSWDNGSGDEMDYAVGAPLSRQMGSSRVRRTTRRTLVSDV